MGCVWDWCVQISPLLALPLLLSPSQVWKDHSQGHHRSYVVNMAAFVPGWFCCSGPAYHPWNLIWKTNTLLFGPLPFEFSPLLQFAYLNASTTFIFMFCFSIIKIQNFSITLRKHSASIFIHFWNLMSENVLNTYNIKFKHILPNLF